MRRNSFRTDRRLLGMGSIEPQPTGLSVGFSKQHPADSGFGVKDSFEFGVQFDSDLFVLIV